MLINPYVFGDPYRSSVSLLLHGDGANGSTTIVDSSPTPKTVTAIGNAKISTAQSKFGGASILFDGSGDSLSVPANSAFNMMSQDMTYELWLKLNTVPSTANRALFSVGGNTGYYQLLVGGNQIRLNSSPNNTVTFFEFTGSQALNTSWHHIALTKSGSTYRIFYDGQSINATGSVTSSIGNNALYIGSNFNVGSTSIDGNIDDFRITSGIARYTANFTLLTTPFPDF